MKIFFIGDAEDFHVVDKFNQATQVLKDKEIFLFSGISIEKNQLGSTLVNDANVVKYDLSFMLFLNFLKNSQFIKNVIKALLYPLQIILLKFVKWRNPGSKFHAFTMYYAVLCYFTRLDCVVTPQASEILHRLDLSKIYRFFAIRALSYATKIIVDSQQMQVKLTEFGIDSLVFKNGFDAQQLLADSSNPPERDLIVSIRGLRALYRIDKIFDARDALSRAIGLLLIYPASDLDYKKKLERRLLNIDADVGTLDKPSMYGLLRRSKLVISIPETDSSPRSVYEAIFAGSAAAVTKSSYLDELPVCMLKRILVVDLDNIYWMAEALAFADDVVSKQYIPSQEALNMCDSNTTMQKISDAFYNE